MSGHWIDVVKGVAMVLPFLALMVLVAWNDAKEDGVSFSEFAKMALGLSAGFLLLLGFAMMAGAGAAILVWAFS